MSPAPTRGAGYGTGAGRGRILLIIRRCEEPPAGGDDAISLLQIENETWASHSFAETQSARGKAAYAKLQTKGKIPSAVRDRRYPED